MKIHGPLDSIPFEVSKPLPYEVRFRLDYVNREGEFKRATWSLKEWNDSPPKEVQKALDAFRQNSDILAFVLVDEASGEVCGYAGDALKLLVNHYAREERKRLMK